MEQRSFRVDSKALCFGTPNNILWGASQPIQVPEIIEAGNHGGTIAVQPYQFNLAAQNGLWKVSPLAYSTDSSDVARAWFAGHESLQDPYAEATRILEVANSPYEQDNGQHRNTPETWAGRVLVVNRYDWEYWGVRQSAVEAYDERDGDYMMKDVYLVDYGHASKSLEKYREEKSNVWTNKEPEEQHCYGVSMVLKNAEYVFARFGLVEDRSCVHSFLFFAGATELSRVVFPEDPQRRPVYIPLTSEQRYARFLSDSLTCSGFKYLRTAPVQPSGLEGPFGVGIVSAEDIHSIQRYVCAQTPIEPQLESDVLQLLNECIAYWISVRVAGAAQQASSQADFFNLAFPAKSTSSSLDALLLKRMKKQHLDPNTSCRPTFELMPQTSALSTLFSSQSVETKLFTFISREGLARAIQVLLEETLELSGNCARDHERGAVAPFDVRVSISMDPELYERMGRTKLFYPSDMWTETTYRNEAAADTNPN